MLPTSHIIISLGVSILLYPLFGFWVLLFLASSILIDFDHYLTYIFKSKKLDLKGAYYFFYERYDRGDLSRVILLFHTIEYFILIAIASFFSKIILLIFLGSTLHISLDIIDYLMNLYNGRNHWGRRISLILNIWYKNLK